MRKRKRGKVREGRQRKTRWKMWSRKRGIEGESEQRGAETEEKEEESATGDKENPRQELHR